jgi:hypothetical protein
MEKSFKISLNHSASAVHLQSLSELSIALKQLGLQQGRPVLVVIGGASHLSTDDDERIRLLFTQVLAPLAQKWGAFVVDGGTDAGVMQLMGQARAETATSFPLIGVCPIDLVTFPNAAPISADAAPLEPNHTHFILVPGSHWGDESQWMAEVASVLADHAPSVTVLINGGEITWKDASQNVQAGREVLVIAGSGRTADKLASGLRGEATDQRAQPLIATGLVQAIDLDRCTEVLPDTIEKIFSGQE